MSRMLQKITKHFQRLTLTAGASTRHGRDMAHHPNDDPVLVRYAGVGAVAEARQQCRVSGKRFCAEVLYELIDKHVATYLADPPDPTDATPTPRTRQWAIHWATEALKVSPRTVETALAFMKEKREAKEVHAEALTARKP